MKKLPEPNKQDLRNFGLILALILGVLFIIIPYFRHKSPSTVMVVITTVLIVWALVLPASMKHLYKVWMAIGELLGWVNTRIILGAVFIALILPISIIMRLMSKDPLHRRLEKDAASYRVTSIQPQPDQLERPY
jgi:polyferredoxin